MAKAVYVGVNSKARKMKKAYIGIGGKARKVKKMYIGDSSGKARLCYSAELEKVGMATALSTTRYDMRAATVGKYALFAGGYISKSSFGYSVSSSVDAYNTSLTKSTPTELSCKRCGHAAASVGGYALFAGGASSHNFLGYGNLVSSVDAYDASLTRSAAHIIGATVAIGGAAVGNYALFAGGTVNGVMTKDTVTSDVLAYDSSLTFTTAPLLSVARANVKGASAGNYALFAGGRAGSFCTTVDAYNASLTRTTATALSSEENRTAAATVGNHAIFVGNTASADIYDASLTKTSAAILSTARTGLAATTVGDYAIFSGGGVADFCDASLTRSSIGTSMTGYDMGAATIGDYALFAGGHSSEKSDTAYDSVEVYTA